MSELSMSAPSLVVQASGDPQLDDGLAILDAGRDAYAAMARGEWSEGLLQSGLAGLDTLGAVIDPFGTLLASGFAWAMDHVHPLPWILDSLAGDPGQVEAMVATWQNLGDRLREMAELHAHYVTLDLCALAGPALSSYRAHAAAEAELLRRMGDVASSVGESVALAGAVVGTVRGLVRDLVAAAAAKVVTVLIREVATLGVATPLVIADITATVSRYTAMVAEWLRKLVDAMARLSALLQKVRGLLDDLMRVLRAAHEWARGQRIASSFLLDDGWADKPLISVRTWDGGIVRANVRTIDRVRIDSAQYGRFASYSAAKNAATNAENLDDEPA